MIIFIENQKTKSIELTAKDQLEIIHELVENEYEAMAGHMSKFDDSEYEYYEKLGLMRDLYGVMLKDLN